jgi:succinate-semialdehyde dehydrogenase/glutarate-semialdehyde dehydrogenase
VLEIVLGDGPTTGQAVIDRADYVSYTGSTATGRKVAVAAAERLIGASLELGGKNSLYVAADADISRAVEGALRSCFSSAGQLCISTERVLVHRDVADSFIPAFVEAVKAMRLGVGLHWGLDMGSLVGQRQLETVTAHVDDAVAKGARVLAGGKARPDIGPFVYEPTVLADVTSAMECRDGETFGPVVALYVVDSDDAAVDLTNDTEYGLNASLWTRDVARGRALAARIRCGTVNINEGYGPAYASAGTPMGGMKQSGIGRRHGREGILKYTESQTVAAQHLIGLGGIPGVSDELFAKGLTVGLRVLKAIGLT